MKFCFNFIQKNKIETNNTFLHTEKLYKLKNNIRNLRVLNKMESKFLYTLSKVELLELIEIYDNCISLVNNLLK